MLNSRTRRGFRLDAGWLCLVPLAAFLLLYELMPLAGLVKSAFTVDGRLSLQNIVRAFQPSIINAFVNSLTLSAVVAVIGTIAGAFLAYIIVTAGSQVVRNALTALADVSANFGGAPLAFAFVITLGSTGMITLMLKQMGVELYPGFRIYSMQGLVLAYLYFEIPLAILLLVPSMEGLRTEWREAAYSLGASKRQYWWNIALPILRPSLISCLSLLFANAFGAYATAWTLTGSSVNLVTVQIAALVRGEVQLDPGLADAIAMLSLVIMMISVSVHRLLSMCKRRQT
ncbi:MULTISPECIES: ABC transporter permease subunit [unclassified Rhizobium]|uniref:ABC transporter permease n=1 Tax=unclassified Rhizobium TaxID=2613769 RepID=UPI00247A2FF7|nr:MULTISPECIES: ABC transporter permease subunit [unclassified Rhizobium]MDH7803252.1 putative spermidine/putrescine transport system permease protein [Rhizobium sp. AN70]